MKPYRLYKQTNYNNKDWDGSNMCGWMCEKGQKALKPKKSLNVLLAYIKAY